MSRSHEFLALRQAESRLAEAASEVEKIRASRDFMLDEQFFKALHILMDSYGFNAADVARLLLARDPDINFPEHDNSTMSYLENLSEFVILDESELIEPEPAEVCYEGYSPEEFRSRIQAAEASIHKTSTNEG